MLDFSLGLLLLLGGVEEDGGAILRAPVRSLAVWRGGVVEVEKGVKDLVVADLFWIEVQLDYLGVASLIGADVFVGGLVELASLVADGRGRDAGIAAKAASTPQKQPAPNVAFSMLIPIRCVRPGICFGRQFRVLTEEDDSFGIRFHARDYESPEWKRCARSGDIAKS